MLLEVTFGAELFFAFIADSGLVFDNFDDSFTIFLGTELQAGVI